MDTDSLSSGSAFLVFLAAFSALSVLQHSRVPPAAPERRRTARLHHPALLPSLKIAGLLALAVSGAALLQSLSATAWWQTALGSLGLLAAVLLIDQAAARLMPRRPAARPAPESVAAANGESGSHANGPDARLPETPAITEAELVGMDQRDREMLRSILQLEETTVREVMVPRLDMVAVEADDSLQSAAGEVIKRGHSRLPVYEENIDHILGIVYARDLLDAVLSPNPEQTLRDLTRQAFIVPESKRVDELLEEFQERYTQIAIVVDEYGGTEGLVTMEDVLEEIVGEIEDEFSRASRREPQIAPQPDGSALVDPGIPIDDIAELYGANIDGSGFDTIGGLVYHQLGRLPQTGDIIQTGELQIEVVQAMGRRLRRLRIRRHAPAKADSGG